MVALDICPMFHMGKNTEILNALLPGIILKLGFFNLFYSPRKVNPPLGSHKTWLHLFTTKFTGLYPHQSVSSEG